MEAAMSAARTKAHQRALMATDSELGLQMATDSEWVRIGDRGVRRHHRRSA